MSNLADLLPAGGGQNNTDFVADGNISSGAPVILTSAGKAAPISGSAESIGSTSDPLANESTFVDFGMMARDIIYDPTADRVIAAINARISGGDDRILVVAGEVGASSITWGTPVTLSGAYYGNADQNCNLCYDEDNGFPLLFFRSQDSSYTDYPAIVPLVVSGSSVSLGTPLIIQSAAATATSGAIVYDTTNDKVVALYGIQGVGNNYQRSSVITVNSTSSLSVTGAAVQNGTNAISSMNTAMAFDPSSGLCVIASHDGVGTYFSGQTIDVSTGSAVFNTQTTIYTDASGGGHVDVCYDSNKQACIATAYTTGDWSNFQNVVVPVTTSGSGASASVSAGTPAFTGTSASVNYYACCSFDSTNNVTVIPFEYTSSDLYYVTCTLSGSSPYTATLTDPSLVAVYSAGQTIQPFCCYDPDQNKTVVIYGTNDEVGSSVAFAPASTNLTSTNLLGIAAGAISDTATGTINTWGSRNEVQTGLTIGSDYYVQTNGSIQSPTALPTYDLGTAALVSNFSVASQEASPTDFAFNTDGTKMYVVGYTNDTVYQYSLSTAFTVSTASYDSVSFSVSSQSSSPRGMTFNNDGTKMYIVCRDNDAVYQYSLSSGFDLSTASYDSVSLDVSPQDNLPTSIRFNANGTKMYIVGAQYEYIFQYGLSSAFDLSTASYDSVYYDFNAQGTDGSGLTFSPDGTRMFIVCDSNNTAFQYSLSSGYDLSTVSYDSKSLTPTDTNPSDIRFSADGTKIFIIGRSEDKVFQYTTADVSTTYLIGKAITATQINIKDYTG